jgi:hypothetical protein
MSTYTAKRLATGLYEYRGHEIRCVEFRSVTSRVDAAGFSRAKQRAETAWVVEASSRIEAKTLRDAKAEVDDLLLPQLTEEALEARRERLRAFRSGQAMSQGMSL